VAVLKPEVDRWSIKQIVWFVFYILCQWLPFIEYATKPITMYDVTYQLATITYGILALFISLFILWLAIKHSKYVLYILIGIAVMNAGLHVVESGIGFGLLSLILPFFNWLIVRKKVE